MSTADEDAPVRVKMRSASLSPHCAGSIMREKRCSADISKTLLRAIITNFDLLPSVVFYGGIMKRKGGEKDIAVKFLKIEKKTGLTDGLKERGKEKNETK